MSSTQDLKVVISGDSSGLEKATETAEKNFKVLGDSIESTTNTAQVNVENLGKALSNVNTEVVNINPGKINDLDKSITRSVIDAHLFVEAIKKGADYIKKFSDGIIELGSNAREIGVSAEYFQRMSSASEECGDKLDTVKDIFNKINETAKKAAKGEDAAAESLNAIGVSVDDLKDKSPEQIFNHVVRAMSSMGDSSIDQAKKIAVCGDSFESLNGSIQDYLDLSNKAQSGLISDSTVSAVESMAKSWDSIKNSLISIADSSGAFKLIENLAKVLNVAAEGLDAKLNGKDEYNGKTWNEVNVSEENRKAAEEYDKKWLKDKQEELNRQGRFSSVAGIILPKDEDGLTPGQRKYAASAQNPYGFKAKDVTAAVTKEEIEQASAQREKRIVEDKKAEEVREESERQKEIEKEQRLQDEMQKKQDELNKRLAYETENIYQRRIRGAIEKFDKTMKEASEAYGESVPMDVKRRALAIRNAEMNDAVRGLGNRDINFLKRQFGAKIMAQNGMVNGQNGQNQIAAQQQNAAVAAQTQAATAQNKAAAAQTQAAQALSNAAMAITSTGGGQYMQILSTISNGISALGKTVYVVK